MTSKVVTVDGARLWWCNIDFKIAVRGSTVGEHTQIVQLGREMSSERGATFNTVLHCLQALEDIRYRVPDFSFFKTQALHEGNPDVAIVSERIARYNQNDVVKS